MAIRYSSSCVPPTSVPSSARLRLARPTFFKVLALRRAEDGDELWPIEGPDAYVHDLAFSVHSLSRRLAEGWNVLGQVMRRTEHRIDRYPIWPHREVRVDIFPHDLFVWCDLEHAPEIAFGDQGVAIG